MREAEPAHPRWRGAFLMIVLLGLTASARGQIVQRIELEEASLTVESLWPSNLLTGWFPVSVTVRSLAESPIVLSVGVQEAYTTALQATGDIRLEPGETRTVTWLVPVRAENSSSHYQFSVRASNGEQGFVTLQRPGPVGTLDDTYTLVSGGGSSLTTADASHIDHAQLPGDWRAYTSLARLVLVTEHGLPSAEVIEAIRTWVAAGGVLQVVGPVDGLGFPEDARFETTADRALLVTGDNGNVTLAAPGELLSEWRYGFGTVQVARSIRTEYTPNWMNESWIHRNSGMRILHYGLFPGSLSSLKTAIPGLSALPVGWLTAILVAFYLVMGPLQFTWLRRRRAPPSRLLITTPLLGLGFAGLLLVGSLLAQGLGVKQSVSSITWLDQQRHHVSVLAKRTVYSGSVFDSTLRYDAGSAVANLSALPHGQAYRVDLERQTLSGAFLPVRTPTDELLVRSTTARQRVAIEKEGGKLYAVSGFETDLHDFWYRDEDGDLFRAASGLPAGARVELQASGASIGGLTLALLPVMEPPYDRATFVTGPDAAHWPVLNHLPPKLPERAYAALMDESPFLDDGGVPRDTVAARHLLVGVLEAMP